MSEGSAGHSDADVLLHAIADAVLGALALGDLGKAFSGHGSEWKGVDSRRILREVVGAGSGARYRVGNVDATVIAQAPRSRPMSLRCAATSPLTSAVERPQISVKATTTERLGFTGREEGIAAMASVLLLAIDSQPGG